MNNDFHEKKILFFLFLGLCHASHAGSMGESNPSKGLVFDFSIGPVWTNPGFTQTLALTPEITKTYTAFKPSNTLVDGAVFLAWLQNLPYHYFAHLGVVGALTSQAGLSGEIWDDGFPQFNNYVYGYHIQHGHVALKAKVFKDTTYSVYPWVSAAIGLGFNRANSYDNQVLITEAIKQNNFQNNTETTFTYVLGAGLQKTITSNWQFGLGYEFADWGKSHLSRANGQTQGSGLALNHLYTNGLLFNITYLY